MLISRKNLDNQRDIKRQQVKHKDQNISLLRQHELIVNNVPYDLLSFYLAFTFLEEQQDII